MDAQNQSVLQQLLLKADVLLERLDALAPARPQAVNWDACAFRWRRRNGVGYLQAVANFADIAIEDLKNIEDQCRTVEQNTLQFVRGLPANNVLLTGARGTGKSSLIRAMLHQFKGQGLRLVEVEKTDLVDLPDIVDLLAERPERFIVFSDDLSFEAGDAGYKVLKSTLDGSVSAAANNILIYATSNRRHLMPDLMADNLQARHTDTGEVHPGEAVEEKISLSERFGLWVSFHSFTQTDYLNAVRHWITVLSNSQPALSDTLLAEARADALRFTLERGSRSGRVALQFARHWVGSRQLG